MAFAVDPIALHRPLGVTLSIETTPRSITLDGTALSVGAPPGTRTIEITTEPCRVASARGIVDGHRVSLLGVAAGPIGVPGRSGLDFFLLTDAKLATAALAELHVQLFARSFGTVAGVALARHATFATGRTLEAPIAAGSLGATTLLVGAAAVAQSLVQQLLRATAGDEGRVVQITVERATDRTAAEAMAEALAADLELRARLATAKGPALALAGIPRTAKLRLTRDGRSAALQLDLAAGTFASTRWIALPPD